MHASYVVLWVNSVRSARLYPEFSPRWTVNSVIWSSVFGFGEATVTAEQMRVHNDHILKLRNSLTPGTFKKLVFIKSNLATVYDYDPLPRSNVECITDDDTEPDDVGSTGSINSSEHVLIFGEGLSQ